MIKCLRIEETANFDERVTEVEKIDNLYEKYPDDNLFSNMRLFI